VEKILRFQKIGLLMPKNQEKQGENFALDFVAINLMTNDKKFLA
jgi:hypothetical protein